MPNEDKPFKQHPKFVGCDFGWKKEKFNLKKRDIRELSAEIRANLNKPSKGKGGSGGGGGTSGTSGSGPFVFLLDFTGHTVAGTSWNYAGNIVCSPSNLTSDQVDSVIANIVAEYAPYNVIVTTDEAVFSSVPRGRRMRCIFTETWEWFGQAGGVAFIGSLLWTDQDAPCFVFTSPLNYNTKFIKEAAAHELGHTCGLYHHARYDANCTFLAEYDTGNGITAPIMGVGYYVPDEGSVFNEGPTSQGCAVLQNDPAILASVLGLKP